MKIFKSILISLLVIMLVYVKVDASEKLSISSKSYNEKTGILTVGGTSSYNETMVSVFDNDNLVSFKTTTAKNNAYSVTFNVHFTKDTKIKIKVGDIDSKEYIIDTLDVKKYNNDVTVYKTPIVTVKDGKDNTIELNWDEIENVLKYEIYRSTSQKGKYSLIATVETNKYVNNNVTYGTAYYYKVNAVGSINSKMSSIVKGVSKPNKVNNVNVVSVGPKNIKISWNKENVTGYEVYLGSKKVTTISKSTTVTYNKKKLKVNTTYKFKVRAYKKVGKKKIYGAFSDILTIKTAPNTPKISVSLKDYNALNINIKTVSGAVKYEVLRSTSKKGKYEKVGELTSGKVYVDGNLNTGSTYYYKVRACNLNNNCGSYSSIASKKVTLKTPGLSVKTVLTKQVIVNVTKVNGAVGYEVYRSNKKNKAYKKISDLTDLENLSIEDETAKGKTYYYKVRGYIIINNKKVYSSYSTVKRIKSK